MFSFFPPSIGLSRNKAYHLQHLIFFIFLVSIYSSLSEYFHFSLRSFFLLFLLYSFSFFSTMSVEREIARLWWTSFYQAQPEGTGKGEKVRGITLLTA